METERNVNYANIIVVFRFPPYIHFGLLQHHPNPYDTERDSKIGSHFFYVNCFWTDSIMLYLETLDDRARNDLV